MSYEIFDGITLKRAVLMNDVSKLIQGIEQLQQWRLELLAGELSPPGAWIHTYEVDRLYLGSGNLETYRYAKWQANEPIFERKPKRSQRSANSDQHPGFTKHQHIGRVSSTTGLGMDEEVKGAYQAWRNRQRLEAIEATLQEIEAILVRAERLKPKQEAIDEENGI